jgi:hypothetical protein
MGMAWYAYSKVLVVRAPYAVSGMKFSNDLHTIPWFAQ